jgi:hypothetical protein
MKRTDLPKSASRFIHCVIGVLRSDCLYGMPDTNGRMSLTESDCGGNPRTLQRVELVDLPKESLIIRAHCLNYNIIESNGCCSGLLDNIADYRHVADYIVISDYNSKVCILYVEMKTSSRSNKYIAQLRCAYEQMRHVNRLIRCFDSKLGKPYLMHRFVKFVKIPLDKQGTTFLDSDSFSLPTPLQINNLPNKAYMYYVNEGEGVPYGKLILL